MSAKKQLILAARDGRLSALYYQGKTLIQIIFFKLQINLSSFLEFKANYKVNKKIFFNNKINKNHVAIEMF